MADDSTPATNTPQPPAPEPASGVLDMARRLLVGTVAMTLDEINELLQRLMGRGELPEAEVKRLVQEYVATKPKAEDVATAAADESTALDKPHGALERSVETILVRLNVPTRSDIESLSRKITLLNEKVTRLKELRDAEKELGRHDGNPRVAVPGAPTTHGEAGRNRPGNGQAN